MARKKKPNPWKNRIVGEGEEAPDQLLANPSNFRVHSTEQGDALDGGLNTLGWIQRVVVNRRTGHIVDGHLRVQRALRRGEPSIPVLYVDLDENEERIALATLDPIAAMAGTDDEQLATLLEGIEADDPQLLQFLADLDPQSGEGGGGSSKPEEAITVWGELINLGDHRLLCGDITDDAHRITVTSGKPDAPVLDFAGLALMAMTQPRNPRQLFIISEDPFACDALVEAWEAATGKGAERITPS